MSQFMPDIVHVTAQDFEAFKVIHLFTFGIELEEIFRHRH